MKWMTKRQQIESENDEVGGENDEMDKEDIQT